MYANADATKSNAKTRIVSASKSRDRPAAGLPRGGTGGMDRDRRSRGDLANADTSRRRSRQIPFERSLGESNYRAIVIGTEEMMGRWVSFCRSIARDTPGMDRRVDRGVARPSEVSHKSKPAVTDAEYK